MDNKMRKELPGILRQIKLRFPEIQLEKGMNYCGNDMVLYVEILHGFLDWERYETLKNDYEAQDYKNYRIRVHGLKSTALMIGLCDLSEQAKELEYASKDGKIDVITEKHPVMMAHLEEVLRGMEEILQ
ncbi:MAG: Hpt domain-containing protein [Lachnospiraceae bacterium]|nr:Hpt domain-containing protein [Lachnospiraceae bacterium]